MSIFSEVPVKKVKRSKFDLSHDVKMTCDMGYLTPTTWFECMPGDSFNIGCKSLLRFAPLVAPIMHQVSVYMHYWFVPYRILWPNWEKFITHDNSSVDMPVHPYVVWSDELAQTGSLGDYFGLPTGTSMGGGNQYQISAMPFAAYLKIYEDYYRDQNLIANLIEPAFGVSLGQPFLGDGDNSANFTVLGTMRKRAWQHDYFTSALPFTQKGVSVGIPFGLSDVAVRVNSGSTPYTVTASPGNITVPAGTANSPGFPADELFAQTSTATNTGLINDLRRAVALQAFLEKNARGGTRYSELIKMHFNTVPQDARLQRAEFITGTRSPVVINEVLNTAGSFDPANPSDPSSPPQGNMSGHALSVTSGGYGKYYCHEHGLIMGIMSVMPKTAYQDGIHRTWFKTDQFDYPWPDFAHLGEQEITNKELYATDFTHKDDTFGYVPRYSEYKFCNSRVAGNFRDSLDFWHLGRLFTGSTAPTLSQDFVECNPDKRIFAVTDPNVNSLYVHVGHEISANRPLPKFGVPRLIG